MTKRLLCATLLLAAVPVFAQGPGGPGPDRGPLMHDEGPGGFGTHQPVTNAPYSATFTNTATEKLQDGTVLTHTITRVASRDSLGRTREEITMPAHGAQTTPHTMVVIFDPVAHTMTRLEADKKIAVVRQIPAPGEHVRGHRGPGNDSQVPPAPAADQANAATPAEDHGPGRHHEDKNVTVADLGSKTIGGVAATGTRTTRTIPACAMGNTAPIISTHEEWYASDLKIELSSNDVDPFRGNHTTTVSGLNREEPAPALFKAPSDYTVQQAPERAGRGRYSRRGDNPPPPPPAGM